MEADDFRSRYYDMVVASCEWRAVGVEDPTTLADQVFAVARARGYTDLRSLYQTIVDVVDHAYRQADSHETILDKLRGSVKQPINKEATLARTAHRALTSQRGSDERLLQMAWWDELSLEEISQVLGRDEIWVREHLSTALEHYTATLARLLSKLPMHVRDSRSDPTPKQAAIALRRAKPGIHHRHPMAPAAPTDNSPLLSHSSAASDDEGETDDALTALAEGTTAEANVPAGAGA
ncbi:MAG: hypothetical protein LBM23_09105 [Propionibacteriaceae bacterium]|jgi:DNA-directed RNA polymerase specialized sigma24 family protein|nr:hypothetical protein [Propionibacteriaceae bacterium]